MDNVHYLELMSSGGMGGMVGSPHPAGQFRAAAAVVHRLHLHNAARQRDGVYPLAVAFPNLADGLRDPAGWSRVFGSDEELHVFRRTCVEAFSGGGADSVFIGKVTQAPKEHEFRSFIRDRSRDREGAGYANRSLARAQRKIMERVTRGDVDLRPPQSSVERAEATERRKMAANNTPRLSLQMRSQSNGNLFRLFMSPSMADGQSNGSVDVYGLSRQASPSGLPHF